MSQEISESFEGKRVLVTGGANGVGRSIVEKFYEAGAKVFALDKDVAGLKTLQIQLPNVSIISVDLSDWETSKKAVEGILPLHHLVNNAGIMRAETVLEGSPESFNLVMNINLTAAFIMTQAFARGVIEHKLGGGTIINISSVADSLVFRGGASYSCSKAGLTTLTKATAAELACHNIRVNCVRPTGMETNLLDKAEESILEDAMNNMSRQVLEAKLQPVNVADLVIFLSGSKSSMMTGSAVTIDCGISVG